MEFPFEEDEGVGFALRQIAEWLEFDEGRRLIELGVTDGRVKVVVDEEWDDGAELP